jgi:general L-amino acid transport system substrate-binding protein
MNSRRITVLLSLIVLISLLAAQGAFGMSAEVAATRTPTRKKTPTPKATPKKTPTPEETPVAEGLLGIIMERDKLICGVNGGLPGFSYLDEETGEFSGFDADYCRALAAAIFGDPEKVDFRPLSAVERAPALQTGEIDVLIRNTTWTISRDASWGNFGPTTFYDGQGMMVTKELEAETLEDLEGATICVQAGTTTELNLTDRMRALGVEFEPVVFEDIDPCYAAYEEGRCDAVTSDRSQLAARRTAFAEPEDHVIMDVVMSKEPLGPVIPHGDDLWFDIVKWVVFATIQAEELDITSENIDTFMDSEDPVTRRFLGLEGELGQELGLENDFVVNVIEEVGNYGEIFDRNLGPDTPFNMDRGPNKLWTDGGLMYSPPFR